MADEENDELVPQKQSLFPVSADDIVTTFAESR